MKRISLQFPPEYVENLFIPKPFISRKEIRRKILETNKFSNN